MTNCKYKLRKLSVGLVSVGTMLIAPTVLGQEVSTSASSTKTSASTNINTNTSTASAGTGTSGTASTTPSVGTSTGGAAGGEAAVASSGGSQSSESAQASTQPQAQTAVAASASTTASPSSSEEKTPKTVTSSTSSTPAASSSSNGNQVTGTEVEPQMMDVEQYKVNKEKTELTVKDDKQQLKIRKDVDELKNKDLFDVKREVKDNGDGTLDVTLKVMPKQIDEGADVMALLDVSQKMTQENFNKAKEQIKRLVTTLTGKSSDGKENHNSFSERIQNELPLKSIIEPQLKGLFKTEDSSWFGRFLNKFSLAKGYQEFKETALLKVLEYLFYKREYIYYNHNLSAIAEAKMAQQEGITFYSVDVTSPNQSANKRTRRSADTPEEKRNKKFDNYLKEMSEGRKFLEGQDVTNKDKFKDTLTELTIKDEFTEKVTVHKDKEYYKTSLIDDRPKVTHQAPYSSWLNSTKESLTWTISKDQLKKAFESGQPLTLTYKLKVEKEKFKEALKKQQERKKRAASPESENTVTDTIISNKISYKINNGTDINSNNNKLEDVKMSYSKFKMPIPELDIEVVPIPEKPLVEPMTPLYPAIPNYPTPDIPTPQLPKDEDLEISGGHGPIVDIVEDTGTGVEGGAQNGVVSTQENKDPIVDITEDTQPGMSGSNDATVINEDTKPKRVFHFDNKESQASEKAAEQKLAPHDSHTTPQASDDTAAPHLPASGDKPEKVFALAALTMVAAAGLLSKKRRNTDKN
ncbi:TPA: fibronectin binding protein [Streptococcus pyogenes]|nr:fibronectin binding protein [Streptococcus pyogenes]